MARFNAEQKYEAIAMFTKGATLKEVCDETGLADYSARELKLKADQYTLDIPPYKTYVWDIETTDFKSDIGTLMVSSFLDLDSGIPNSRTIHDFEGTLLDQEMQLAAWTADMLVGADALIGHNIKAFDRNFLSGVLARSHMPQAPKRTYIDTMLISQYGVKGRIGNSMANLADIYGLPVPKDKPSKNDWRLYIGGDPGAVERITTRCETDVLVNALLWHELKEYWYQWRGER
ncbi:hypothetical protein LCGC14_3094300 [marine sediment metagenome]|uniref:YprB ribonuclease H-like domain-containing protein n=2 Tax=marine sediment metagenome TaxID=412755 RepID=A0A0F8W9N2_9ZZZZ